MKALKPNLKHQSQSKSRQRQKEGLPSIQRLSKLKSVALRRRVWFRVLTRIERGVLDLTMRCVDNIRSTKLAKVVTAILSKLQSTLESFADQKVRTIGRSLAEKMSAIAVGWGNHSARKWAGEDGYARYLALCFSHKESGV